MSKFKSTPGPWKAIYNGFYYDIKCSEEVGGENINAHSPNICNVSNNENYGHTNYNEFANAHLIAAAPKMRDALIKHAKYEASEVGSVSEEIALLLEEATGMSIDEVLNENTK